VLFFVASLLHTTEKNMDVYMKFRITILSILLFTSITLNAQQVSKFAGGASNLFLRSELSTRVTGLSGAFTAIANDENALYYNPAGLANISQGAVGFNHSQWFEGIRMDNVIFGYNFDRKLGIGISVAHLWMDALQGKDSFGNLSGTDVYYSSSVINLGLGYKIHPSFYLGLGIKYFQDNLHTYSASGLALDVGLYTYVFTPGLSFGVSAQNIGGDIEYDSVQEQIPFTYRAGIAYKIPGIDLRLATDVVKSVDSDFALSEYTLLKTFSLRFGNKFTPGQQFSPGYGAGLNISKQYSLDYTFHAFNDLGQTHRFAFTFRFNLPKVKIRRSPSTYKSYRITKSRAPTNVYYKFENDQMVIHWGKVYGAVYNVYAKNGKDGHWK
jgi:hypothetical protein